MQKNKQFHSGNGDNVGRDKITNIYSSNELTAIAENIKVILKQFDKTCDLNTTSGKMEVATKAIEKVENDTNLTERIISALKTGSISALESLLNHPAASFFISALKDWHEKKTKQ